MGQKNKTCTDHSAVQQGLIEPDRWVDSEGLALHLKELGIECNARLAGRLMARRDFPKVRIGKKHRCRIGAAMTWLRDQERRR